MLPLEGFRYSKMADVPLGNLMLCNWPHEGQLALRIETESDDRTQQQPGALYLRHTTQWQEVAPVVFGGISKLDCLDLGVPRFALNADSTSDALAKRPYDARPGLLSLSGDNLSILANYGSHIMGQAWWDVRTGKRHTAEARFLIARWCVGLSDVEGKFTPQLRYPEDFTSDG